MLAIRNYGKLAEMAHCPSQSPKPIVVLNHAGHAGGLSQVYMEQAAGVQV